MDKTNKSVLVSVNNLGCFVCITSVRSYNTWFGRSCRCLGLCVVTSNIIGLIALYEYRIKISKPDNDAIILGRVRAHGCDVFQDKTPLLSPLSLPSDRRNSVFICFKRPASLICRLGKSASGDPHTMSLNI